MKRIIILVLVCASFFGCTSTQIDVPYENPSKITWEKLVPVGTKKVTIQKKSSSITFEIEVFSNSINLLIGKPVEITGFYVGTNSLFYKSACSINIAFDPPHKRDKFEYFEHWETIWIDELKGVDSGDEITIQGILKIDTTGTEKYTLRMEDIYLENFKS